MQRQRKRNEIAKFVEMEVDGAHRTLCDICMNMQLLDTTTQDLHQVQSHKKYNGPGLNLGFASFHPVMIDMT